ncbi:hypothetical protein CDAR_602291 [Caerostris darwini]|uniref:Uncharacterized protein n=1 Tax=Caerostris darwini TaxID=1538125 RepID=A0AAV4NBM9_9ARAC|nr:hypothetical protein CDAR_602291 [Caerostris darwini]
MGPDFRSNLPPTLPWRTRAVKGAFNCLEEQFSIIRTAEFLQVIALNWRLDCTITITTPSDSLDNQVGCVPGVVPKMHGTLINWAGIREGHNVICQEI